MNATIALPHKIRSRRRERFFQQFLRPAGIQLNGRRPYDLTVRNDVFYDRALPRGVSGILDAYVDGWWECDRLDDLTARILARHADAPATGRIFQFLTTISARLLNRQSRQGALRVRRHYDLGNDLFAAMLDRRMVYSCGYWKDAADLDEAQEAKLDLVIRKLGLRPGMRVLDIGCGWGSFLKFAAERHGVTGVGITLSSEQCELGKKICAGLPVELRVQDYRELADAPFDAIVSIGMFEHVGYKNYRAFLQEVRRLLKPEGLFLLHTIGGNISRVATEPWIDRNIFPAGMLPSARQITEGAEGLFVLEDWHNFGSDYDRTLMAWFENFRARWPELREKYGDRFYRKWTCYLLTCAGAFRARDMQLWQIVFSPFGVAGGYSAPR
jgi:cyclopropane-fatty-acyl-phospholipid synthase